MNLTTVKRAAENLGVKVEVTQNSKRYGEIILTAPTWHCLGFDGESHWFSAGWGVAQAWADRHEAYDAILEMLSSGVCVCDCETCCDSARSDYDLSDDAPDGLVRDFAKDRGDLPH